MFKRINEAHDVLSDQDKRAQYDHQRRFGTGSPGGSANHQNFAHGWPGGNFHFSFGQGMPFDDIFNQMFGQGFGRQQPPKNRDWQFNLNISLEDAFTGKSVPVQFDANGQNTNITVSIPAGVQQNSRLRFQGLGDRTLGSQPPGDLYVTVVIADHPRFHRDGPHLHVNLSCDAVSVILGCSQQFVGIDGSNLSVQIPSGTQHGTMLRMQGQGMPSHNNARQRGDLFIKLQVEIPKDLTTAQQDLLRELQRQRSL